MAKINIGHGNMLSEFCKTEKQIKEESPEEDLLLAVYTQAIEDYWFLLHGKNKRDGQIIKQSPESLRNFLTNDPIAYHFINDPESFIQCVEEYIKTEKPRAIWRRK